MMNQSIIPDLEFMLDDFTPHTATGVHLSPSQVILQVNRLDLVIRMVRNYEIELTARRVDQAHRDGTLVVEDLATEQLLDLAKSNDDNVVRPMFGTERRNGDAV